MLVVIKSYYKELTHTVVGAEQASPNSIGWTTQEGRPQFLGMAEDSVCDTVSSGPLHWFTQAHPDGPRWVHLAVDFKHRRYLYSSTLVCICSVSWRMEESSVEKWRGDIPDSSMPKNQPKQTMKNAPAGKEGRCLDWLPVLCSLSLTFSSPFSHLEKQLQ